MPLTAAQHRRAAEKLLSQASFMKPDKATPHLDPQSTALIIARAQVHATLATAPDITGDDVEPPRPDAVARVVVGHIAEAEHVGIHSNGYESSCPACQAESREADQKAANE